MVPVWVVNTPFVTCNLLLLLKVVRTSCISPPHAASLIAFPGNNFSKSWAVKLITGPSSARFLKFFLIFGKFSGLWAADRLVIKVIVRDLLSGLL